MGILHPTSEVWHPHDGCGSDFNLSWELISPIRSSLSSSLVSNWSRFFYLFTTTLYFFTTTLFLRYPRSCLYSSYPIDLDRYRQLATFSRWLVDCPFHSRPPRQCLEAFEIHSLRCICRRTLGLLHHTACELTSSSTLRLVVMQVLTTFIRQSQLRPIKLSAHDHSAEERWRRV